MESKLTIRRHKADDASKGLYYIAYVEEIQDGTTDWVDGDWMEKEEAQMVLNTARKYEQRGHSPYEAETIARLFHLPSGRGTAESDLETIEATFREEYQGL